MSTISKLLLATVFSTASIFADTAADQKAAAEAKDQPKLEMPEELKVVPIKKYNDEEAKQIVEVVLNYIRTNPDKFMQLMQLSMQFKEAQKEEQVRNLLDTHKDKLMSTDNTIVLGNPKGTVTMVLIADPLCPNCHVLTGILRKVIKQQPALRVIMHQWAFVSPESAKVAKFLQAAYKENSSNFPKLMEGFLALDKAPSDDMMKGLLTGAKYDFDKVKVTAESAAMNSIIEGTQGLAKALELPGAPILLAKDPEGKLLIVPPASEAELGKLVAELAKASTPAATKNDKEKSSATSDNAGTKNTEASSEKPTAPAAA